MNARRAQCSDIPPHLRNHFRAIACAEPDAERICAVSLLAEGFSQAQVMKSTATRSSPPVKTIFLSQSLAKKIVTLYRLAAEQLSSQRHYDWGLRSIKATLKLAGETRHHRAHLSEFVIVIQTLREVNLPRLAYEDVPLFFGLLKVCITRI